MRPGGEYREKGERDWSVWELREFFLDKVADLAPEVLEELRNEVLPAFRQAYEATRPPPERREAATEFGEPVDRERPPEWVQWRFQDGEWGTDSTTDWPDELVAFHDQLCGWADNCNLREPWVLDAALRMLRFWRQRDSSPASDIETLRFWQTLYSQASVEHVFQNQDRDIEGVFEVFRTWREKAESYELRFLPIRFDAVFKTPHFTFEFEGWVPQNKLWHTYEQELRDAFEEELEAYGEERRQGPEERDLEPPPEIRAPHHFKWLVLWQVQERSYREIAEDYNAGTYNTPTGTSSSTVREGVHHKADLIGLTRRTED